MKKTRLLAFLLTACLATTCFLSGTVAKYSSTATGTANPTVAKWAFNVENANIATTNIFTFTPFAADVIKDSDSTSTETDVVSGSIAPGTSGSFAIDLKNTSEVTAAYRFDFTGDKGSFTGTVPLKFSLDNSTWVNFANISDLANQAEASGTLAFTEGSNTKIVTIYWKWEFEQGTGAELTANDANDVAFTTWANTSGNTVTITATVTATQDD